MNTSPPSSTNTHWHQATVSRLDRQLQNKHRSAVLWLTGLSGAGKSTLAHSIEGELHARGYRTFVLDGDNVRHGLCGDLGFSLEDRSENIRRIGEVAKLFIEAGIIVIGAFISPLRSDRDRVRKLFTPSDFLEIYCEASLEVCESRDTKGLYQRARAGEVKEFTGITSPYEAPNNPEITVKTGDASLDHCLLQVLSVLEQQGIVSKQTATPTTSDLVPEIDKFTNSTSL
jgi:adenylylsulfate kinase